MSWHIQNRKGKMKKDIEKVMEWMAKKASKRQIFTGLKPRKYRIKSHVHYSVNSDGSKMPYVFAERKK